MSISNQPHLPIENRYSPQCRRSAGTLSNAGMTSGQNQIAWSMELRAWSMELRAWSMELRAWNMESRARNMESRIVSHELRARSMELRTVLTG